MATFTTRTEYAECINELVEVHGNRDEGITAVYVVDPAYGGLDILESLSDRQYDALYEELEGWIAEEAGDAADRLYDQMRDDKLTGDR